MASPIIEGLLEKANSSTEGDTSVNGAKRAFLDETECAASFETTKSRLKDVEEWSNNSSPSEYDLFDASGSRSNGQPISVGQFIRIGLYGSGKYDWVRVVSVTDEPAEFIITVKPSYDPTEKPPKMDLTSHFFAPDATNNFCVQREGKTVAFYVIGLNEHQNTEFTDSLIESARNAAVANVGYYSGLQKSVWKEFCSNFLKSGEEKEG